MTSGQPTGFNVNYHLARFHRVSRRYGPAIRLHQQALAERERTLGPDHPETLRSCTGLANSFYAAGHFQMAMDLFRETPGTPLPHPGPRAPRHPAQSGQPRQLLPRHRRLPDCRPDAPPNPRNPRTGTRPRPSQHPGQPQQPRQGRRSPGHRFCSAGKLRD